MTTKLSLANATIFRIKKNEFTDMFSFSELDCVVLFYLFSSKYSELHQEMQNRKGKGLLANQILFKCRTSMSFSYKSLSAAGQLIFAGVRPLSGI